MEAKNFTEIRDCFMCSRPISNGDCDKYDHKCSICEYYNCEYCTYKEQCEQHKIILLQGDGMIWNTMFFTTM